MAQMNINIEDTSEQYTDNPQNLYVPISNLPFTVLATSNTVDNIDLPSQSQVILDISYPNNHEEQDIQDLKKLLSEWNQEYLLKHLVGKPTKRFPKCRCLTKYILTVLHLTYFQFLGITV